MHEEAGAARRGHPHPAARFEDSEACHQQWFGTHPSAMSASEVPLPNRQRVAGYQTSPDHEGITAGRASTVESMSVVSDVVR